VTIANGVHFDLLSTIPYDTNLRLTQSASATYKDKSHDLIFQTEILQNKLVMVGLTPTGTRLFTIQMDQKTVSAEGVSAMVDKIKPEYLLADLQISLWPLEQIRSNLSNATITQSSPFERVVTNNKDLIISIKYSRANEHFKGTIDFNHHQRQYQIIIEPLQIEELPNTAQKVKADAQ
jgi:hypothetical protein